MMQHNYLSLSLYGSLLLAALLLSGCPAANTAQQVKLEPFFDLEEYIDTEVQRLAKAELIVDKTIVLDGKTETKRLDKLDMAEELKLLRNSDINRPAWLDQYRVDSTFANGQLQNISYTAQDEDLRTRRMDVRFISDAQVSMIEVQNESSTFLSSSKTTINYQPATGITLFSQQEITGGTSTDLSIELRFVNQAK